MIGTYIFWKSGAAQYVGQSTDILDRVRTHEQKMAFEFDCVTMVDVSSLLESHAKTIKEQKAVLDWCEAREIERQNPSCNLTRPSVERIFHRLPMSLKREIISKMPNPFTKESK